MTVVMLAITISLGVWQLHRLAWKRALLAEIDLAESLPPAPYTGMAVAFRRVVVEGRFLPEVARYGAEVRAAAAGAEMGAHVLMALVQGPGLDPIIVDRGWAPIGHLPPPSADPVRVEAYVRPPEYRVRFGPADDPAGRRFFALDPAAIGASMGLAQVAPFTLVALGPAGPVLQPATALPRPPNDHLSYALTWFGLSAALLAVFTVYVLQSIGRGARP